MPKKIDQEKSSSYHPENFNPPIPIKENKKNTIDKKISALEGKIENLRGSLRDGNALIKIKSFVMLIFIKIHLYFLKKSSLSLTGVNRGFTPSTVHLLGPSEQSNHPAKPLTTVEESESGSEKKTGDQTFSEKPQIISNANVKSFDQIALEHQRDRVFSETMLYREKETKAKNEGGDHSSMHKVNHNGGEYTSMREFLPAKEPKESVSPDPIRKEEWVEAHKPEFKPLAKILIDNINHITHEEFKSQLKESVEDFNNYLRTQTDQSYIIVIPGNFEKSGLWVTSIAKDFLERPPEKIIMMGDPSLEEVLKEQTSKNIVMFDDAAYSGKQMSEEYFPRFKNMGIKVHPIIPFMTKSAEKKLEIELNKLGIEHKCYKHATMDSFSKFLSEEQKKLLRKSGGGEFSLQPIDEETNPSGFDNLTLTYFDHKKADMASMVVAIDTGELLYYLWGSKKIPFVGKVNSPYKSLPQ